MSFPMPISSFPSRFLWSWYPIRGQCLPKSRYWLEQTALQRLFCERSCLWFLTASSRYHLGQGKTGLHSDTMWYEREYVARHIGEIGVLWVRFLLLSPPVGYVRYPKCTANLHWVWVVILEIWIDLPPVRGCLRRRIQIEPWGGQ